MSLNSAFSSHAEQPWIRANDTNNEENDKAKEAYRALKTISLRRSDLEEYKNFELRVKERAELKYNYTNITGKDYEVCLFPADFKKTVIKIVLGGRLTMSPSLGYVVPDHHLPIRFFVPSCCASQKIFSEIWERKQV